MTEMQQTLLDADPLDTTEATALFNSFPAAFLYWQERGGKLFESLPAFSGEDGTKLCWIVAGTQYAANRALIKAKGVTLVRRVQRSEAHGKIAELAREMKGDVEHGSI